MRARNKPKAKKVVNPKVPRTRNADTWTEAQFWAEIRSALRAVTLKWVPRRKALNDGRRVMNGKLHNQCEHCKRWFPMKSLQAHHRDPCGSLRCAGDLEGFLERLLPEDERKWQRLCKPCHKLHERIARLGSVFAELDDDDPEAPLSTLFDKSD